MDAFNVFGSFFDPIENERIRFREAQFAELRKITDSFEMAQKVMDALRYSTVSFEFAKSKLMQGFLVDDVLVYIKEHKL